MRSFSTAQLCLSVLALRAERIFAQSVITASPATSIEATSSIETLPSLVSVSPLSESASSTGLDDAISSSIFATPSAVISSIESINSDPSILTTSSPSPVASSTLLPESTASTGGNSTTSSDGDDFLPAALTDGVESSQPITAGPTSPEQHRAEQEVNKPQTVVTPEVARELAIMETVLFDHFVNTAPAPADKGVLQVPANVSNCASVLKKRGLVGVGRKFEKRSLRGSDCKVVSTLEIPLYFHYIRASKDAERPLGLKDRIDSSATFLNSVFAPLGITFTTQSIRYWYPTGSGANGDWSELSMDEPRLQKWQKKTRTADDLDLTVWIVNDLSDNLNGYATFPDDLPSNSGVDGVVIRQGRLSPGGQSTLVHEVGHWMGLRHTFGRMVTNEADDCQRDDGLLRTTLTPGLDPNVFQCVQTPCDGSAARKITNWMSYSPCRGEDDIQAGFHTDQKAAMFARVLQWRRGYTGDECQVRDPGTTGRVKRSSMQDLVDGQCPDIEKQVQTIMEQPTREATNSSTTGGKNGTAGTGGSGGSKTSAGTVVRGWVGGVVGVVVVGLVGLGLI